MSTMISIKAFFGLILMFPLLYIGLSELIDRFLGLWAGLLSKGQIERISEILICLFILGLILFIIG